MTFMCCYRSRIYNLLLNFIISFTSNKFRWNLTKNRFFHFTSLYLYLLNSTILTVNTISYCFLNFSYRKRNKTMVSISVVNNPYRIRFVAVVRAIWAFCVHIYTRCECARVCDKTHVFNLAFATRFAVHSFTNNGH